MFRNFKKSSVVISIIFVLFTCTLCSCNSFGSVNNNPEFSVSKPVYKAGKIENSCELGGVFFDFYNKSKAKVVFIEVRMNVFDRMSKKNVFTGKGTILSQMECSISSGEIKNLCIPLDDYITIISDEEYIIDQFYVSTVKFSDGAVWNDYYGIYATSSE